MEELIYNFDWVDLLDLKNKWYLIIPDYQTPIPISVCQHRFIQSDLNVSRYSYDYHLVEIETKVDLQELSEKNKNNVGFNTYLKECFITNGNKKVIFNTQLTPFESSKYILYKFFGASCTFESKFGNLIETQASIEDKILILEESDWYKEAKQRIESEDQLRLNQKLALNLLKYRKEHILNDKQMCELFEIDSISLRMLLKCKLDINISTLYKIQNILNEKISN